MPEKSPHETCLEHRGMGLQVRASLAILSLAAVGIAYQVFIQVPNLRYEVAGRIGEMNTRIVALEMEKTTMKEQIAQLMAARRK